jgi:hypothetical protein
MTFNGPAKNADGRRDVCLDIKQRRPLIENATADVARLLHGLAPVHLRPGDLAALNQAAGGHVQVLLGPGERTSRQVRPCCLAKMATRGTRILGNGRVRAAIWLSLYTGCRRGEVLAIRPEHIVGTELVIPAGNTKTLRTRSIPIVAPVRPWLEFLPMAIGMEGLKTGFRRAADKAGGACHLP